MGTYEVSCANRQKCDHGSHIVEVELTAPEGTKRVGMPVVRLMLSSGDSLHVVDPGSGVRVGVRKARCACGNKTIRPEAEATGVLEGLAPCSDPSLN